jgi:hypothetical protein
VPHKLLGVNLPPNPRPALLDGPRGISSSISAMGRIVPEATRETSEVSQDLPGLNNPAPYSIGQEGMTSSISVMRRMVSLRATTILP